jgi:hypothetical protein
MPVATKELACVLCWKPIPRDDTVWLVAGQAAHWMCGWKAAGHPEEMPEEPDDLPAGVRPVVRPLSEIVAFVRAVMETTRVDYAAYLRTDAWRAVRDEAIARAGGRCAICNADGPLQGHHRTYENLGYERPGDVIALCRPCHRRHHGRHE